MRYAPPKGTVAVAPKAWGEEFDVFFGPRAATALFEEAGGYAVVDIHGPLTQHSGYFGDSYDDIRERFAAACESKSAAVCLRIDSPGGDWCGALELARDLRAVAASKGKHLVAFTDGMALSAGYAIACAATEIVATESASVGSIGVWASLVDLTQQDAMRGLRVQVVSSGSAKADRNPHVGITDEAYNRMQGQVDEQAELFFELVSEFRGLAVSKVKALQGADVFGQRGVAAGLSDRLVNSWSTFLTSEGTSMATKASKYDEAYGLLKQAAEGDDEEAAKKAKKCLKALEDEEPEEKEKKDKEAKAKAEADEEEKKAKAAADDKEKEEKAKALAANSIALATEVATLKAKDAARDAAEAKAKNDAALADLFAKRPDLSEAQRAALAAVPLASAQALVESWPRVVALPGSAASALTPLVSGGERRASAYVPRLSADDQAMLDASDPTRRSGAAAPRAVMQGSQFHVPIFTKEQARKRLAELKAEQENI